jgi:hypothetical protein
MTKLLLLNFILLQWFCIRLARKCEKYDSTKHKAAIVIVDDRKFCSVTREEIDFGTYLHYNNCGGTYFTSED